MLLARIFVFCTFALARVAAAQTPTGTIDGVVVDTSGAVVPGVPVVLTHEPTGAVRETVSDAQGIFRVPLLPVGPYTVKATLAGFQPFEARGIALTIGQAVSSGCFRMTNEDVTDLYSRVRVGTTVIVRN